MAQTDTTAAAEGPLLPELATDKLSDSDTTAVQATSKTENRTDAATAPPSKRSGGAVAALAGGALAAVAGFGLAHFDILKLDRSSAMIAELQQTLADQARQTAALQTDLAALRDRPVAAAVVDSTLSDRLTAVESAVAALDVSTISGQLDDVFSRLSALEALPAAGPGASSAALTALQGRIAALEGAGTPGSEEISALVTQAEASLASAAAKAETLRTEATALAARLRAHAALDRLEAAVDTGAPFASAMQDLDGTDVPQVLIDLAATGIPALSDLQTTFPDYARTAMTEALRDNMGATWTDRVSNFLRSQTGARSLEPREGTDPDAILSRAEAALEKGDLTSAMTEIATLPDSAKVAMADWLRLAQTRLDAQAAVVSLAQAVRSEGAGE